MNKTSLIAIGIVVGAASSSYATEVFAHDMRNNRFVTFDTLTPGTQTVLNAAQATDYFAMDFNAAATTLYAVSSLGNLETLDLTNGGTLSSVAITGWAATSGVTGLAIASDDTAYLSANVTGVGGSLYTLNLTTGVATLIGAMGASTDLIVDIAINTAGQMVGHNIATDTFHFVDPTTGGMTLIGPHGLAANFAQGMDFDWSNNTLYAAVYTGGGTLTYGSVNLGTGSITSIPGIISGEYEMAVRSPVPEPASIAALGLGALALLKRRRKAA